MPTGKELPGLWLPVSVTEPELSVAVGTVQDTLAVVAPGSAVAEWYREQPVITGFSLSDEKRKVYE